ncbi:hypothetical protein ACFQJ7_08745 [Halovenus rubra]|uniref:Uncharacterized protein n=2 Tax=Halovenus rubra TaxID=869890 RepID=A0ABD5X4R1_9EURY|nr:hypothetical protein [Halovenus rubra]
MTEQIHERVIFEATHPEEMKDWLQNGNMPSTDIRIFPEKAADSVDRPHSEDSLFGYTLAELSQGIAKLLNDEQVCVELDRTYLRLIPEPEKHAIYVYFDIMDVPEQKVQPTKDLYHRDRFISELYEFCSGWYTKASELNPDLEENEWFQEIGEALAEAEEALERNGFEL